MAYLAVVVQGETAQESTGSTICSSAVHSLKA